MNSVLWLEGRIASTHEWGRATLSSDCIRSFIGTERKNVLWNFDFPLGYSERLEIREEEEFTELVAVLRINSKLSKERCGVDLEKDIVYGTVAIKVLEGRESQVARAEFICIGLTLSPYPGSSPMQVKKKEELKWGKIQDGWYEGTGLQKGIIIQRFDYASYSPKNQRGWYFWFPEYQEAEGAFRTMRDAIEEIERRLFL